jgi:hypothetical protein
MIRDLIDNLSLSYELIVVHCDNQGAIYPAKNRMYHEKTKHINVKYHFILEIISHGLVSIKKITTAENHIDMLMKSISAVKFKHYLVLLCSTLYSLYFGSKRKEREHEL